MSSAANLDEIRAVGDAVEHAPFGIELVAELVEVGDLEARSESNRSAIRRDLAEEKANERRLAGAVWSNEPDAIAACDGRGEIANDDTLAVREAHAASLDHEPARSLGLLGLEFDRAGAFTPSAAFDPEGLECAHTPFVPGTTSLNPRADPDLLLRQLLVELFPFTRFGGQRGALSLEVLVVVRAPIDEPPAVELDDSSRDASQEGPVVRHEQKRRPAVDEKILNPFDGVDVEMIRRLIEQQHIGLPNEGAGQQGLSLSPTRGVGKRGVGLERQMRKDGVDTSLHLPRVGAIERVVQTVEFA